MNPGAARIAQARDAVFAEIAARSRVGLLDWTIRGESCEVHVKQIDGQRVFAVVEECFGDVSELGWMGKEAAALAEDRWVLVLVPRERLGQYLWLLDSLHLSHKRARRWHLRVWRRRFGVLHDAVTGGIIPEGFTGVYILE